MGTADGGALCFECRFEWDPSELVAGPAPVVLPFAMASVDDVFGPPPGWDDHADWTCPNCGRVLPGPIDHLCTMITGDEMDFLLGQLATLEGGQQALIVETIDLDHIVVMFASGERADVGFADVIRVDPLPEVSEPTSDVHEGDRQKEAT